MKLVVVIFAMTVTSLMVFKTFVHGKMFNCKMTEEPENDSDDDWVWDFDLDKVINAYQI